MTEITLDANQLTILATDGCVELSPDVAIELHDNRLILNDKGRFFYAEKSTMEFKTREVFIPYYVEYMQKLVCEHLNLRIYQVIYSESHNDEYEFIIRFAPNKERRIYVCDNKRAVKNTREQTDEFLDILTNTPNIGIYRQLDNSLYYFRWLEDMFN